MIFLRYLTMSRNHISPTPHSKGTQIINASTNETPGEGVLQYVIAHRFGSFNDDYLYNFFGLDNAQIRMQLDYGVTNRLNIGIGRSSFLKVADGFVKYKPLLQTKGKQKPSSKHNIT